MNNCVNMALMITVLLFGCTSRNIIIPAPLDIDTDMESEDSEVDLSAKELIENDTGVANTSNVNYPSAEMIRIPESNSGSGGYGIGTYAVSLTGRRTVQDYVVESSESSARLRIRPDSFQRNPTSEPLISIRNQLKAGQLFLEFYPGAVPDKDEHRPYEFIYPRGKNGTSYIVHYSYPKGHLIVFYKPIDGAPVEQYRVDASGGPKIENISPKIDNISIVKVPHPSKKWNLARPTQAGLYMVGGIQKKNKSSEFCEYRWPLIPLAITNNGSYFIHGRPDSEQQFKKYNDCKDKCNDQLLQCKDAKVTTTCETQEEICIQSCEKAFPRIVKSPSHGCIRIDVRDRNELNRQGYLKKFPVLLIRLYEEEPPPQPMINKQVS